jgi:hypothetical protein
VGYKDPVQCRHKGCKEETDSSRFGRIRATAAGWFFQKNGDCWCPRHVPEWVVEWRERQADIPKGLRRTDVKLEFYLPEGELTPEVLRDMLQQVMEPGVQVPLEAIGRWTRLEFIMAYDWAAREYLRASDNKRVQRREQPSFVAAAEARTAEVGS